MTQWQRRSRDARTRHCLRRKGRSPPCRGFPGRRWIPLEACRDGVLARAFACRANASAGKAEACLAAGFPDDAGPLSEACGDDALARRSRVAPMPSPDKQKPVSRRASWKAMDPARSMQEWRNGKGARAMRQSFVGKAEACLAEGFLDDAGSPPEVCGDDALAKAFAHRADASVGKAEARLAEGLLDDAGSPPEACRDHAMARAFARRASCERAITFAGKAEARLAAGFLEGAGSPRKHAGTTHRQRRSRDARTRRCVT